MSMSDIQRRVALLERRLTARLTSTEGVVDSLEPLVVTLADGTKLEGLTPIGYQLEIGKSATVFMGDGHGWALGTVGSGEQRAEDMVGEVQGQLSQIVYENEQVQAQIKDISWEALNAVAEAEAAHGLASDLVLEMVDVHNQLAAFNGRLEVLTGTDYVVIQPDAPPGDSNILWIDSDTDVPHVWNGTAWVPFTSSDPEVLAEVLAAAKSAAAASRSVTELRQELGDFKAEAIISSVIEYGQSSSPTTLPTSWSTATPPYIPGTYNWSRPRVTYGDGTTSNGPAALITGNDGEKGDPGAPGGKGDPGDPGSPGADGVSLDSVTSFFKLVVTGASAPAKPTAMDPTTSAQGSWASTEPGWIANRELYRTERFVFSDGDFSYSDVSKVSSYTAATEALTSANGKNSRIALTRAPGPSDTTHPDTGLPLVLGDTWWQWNNATERHVVGQWTWAGTSAGWVVDPIRSEVIANLDVSKLTVTGSSRFTQAVIDRLVADEFFAKAAVVNKLTVTSAQGLYPDPMFYDAELRDLRDANTAGFSWSSVYHRWNGTGSMWLTREGLDEGESIPLIPGKKYTVRVMGTGLTESNGYRFARRDANGYTLPAGTNYFPGGMEISAEVGEDARFQLYRSAGTSTVYVTAVHIYESVGGVMIEDGGITAGKINAGAFEGQSFTGGEFIGMTMTSPTLQTSTSANTGIKIVGNTFRAYGSGNDPLIDINGSTGTIRGVNIIGVSVTGSSTITGARVRTAASGRRAELYNQALQFYSTGTTVVGELYSSGNSLIINSGAGISGGRINLGGTYSQFETFGGDIYITPSTGNPTNPNGGITLSPGSSSFTRGGWRVEYNTSLLQNVLRYVGPGANYTGGGNDMPGTGLTSNLYMSDNGIVYRVSDSGWVQVSLTASWNHVSGWPVRVRKVGGTVFIKGFASLVSGHNYTNTIATLPAAYRPESGSVHLGASLSSGNLQTVMPQVGADGTVTLVSNRVTGAPTGYIALSGSWPAAN